MVKEVGLFIIFLLLIPVWVILAIVITALHLLNIEVMIKKGTEYLWRK
jgi:hypothetical protein